MGSVYNALLERLFAEFNSEVYRKYRYDIHKKASSGIHRILAQSTTQDDRNLTWNPAPGISYSQIPSDRQFWTPMRIFP